MKRLVLFVVALVFVFANTVIAVDNPASVAVKNATKADVKKASTPQIQKMPALKPGISIKERPVFTMTCPNPNEIGLNLFYVITTWVVNPDWLNPEAFTSASANIDPNDKTKVKLACVYHVVADYVAKHPYNGHQTCYCDSTTGEGMISFKKPEGYTTNVAGTSHAGYLPVKKTGEKIQNQMLECQFHLDGQAHLYKVYQTPSNLSACQSSGREVNCQY